MILLMRQYYPLFPIDTVNRQFFEVRCRQYHIHLAALRGAHDLDAEPCRQACWMLNRFIELHHEVDVAAPGSVVNARPEQPDIGLFAENLGSGRLDDIDFVLIQSHVRSCRQVGHGGCTLGGYTGYLSSQALSNTGKTHEKSYTARMSAR